MNKTVLVISAIVAFCFGARSTGSTKIRAGGTPPPVPGVYPNKKCNMSTGICEPDGPKCEQLMFRNGVQQPAGTPWQVGDVAKCYNDV